MPDNSEAGQKPCIACGVVVGSTGTNGSFRCKDYNNLKTRLHKVLGGMDQETQSFFRDMQKADKQSFCSMS